MKKWATFPWYIFLLPLFYIWHVNNAYFPFITLTTSLLYLGYYILLSLIFFMLSFLLLKNSIKAGILTTSFLAIFFFFGAIYDLLKGTGALAFLFSYKFLLGLIFLSLFAIAIILRKRKAPIRLNKFFLILFSLLVMLEAGISVLKQTKGKERKKVIEEYSLVLEKNSTGVTSENLPDIFFIVFDAYTSSKALKKYFHFNNDVLDSSLLQKGFYISTNSKSNYNSTPLSIGSAFNMQYFNSSLEGSPNDAYHLLEGAYFLKNSFIPSILEKKGYNIVNYGMCDIKDHPASVTPVFREYEIKALSLETLWGRIQRDILWNVTPLISLENPVFNSEKFIRRNLYNYSGFLDELKKESNTPRFVVGHLLLPRRPAYVDRTGKPRTISMNDFTDKTHDSLYLEQLIYANTLIDSLSTIASKPRTRPLVLIIEGDHGNRYGDWGKHIREKQFMNLNLYYFSDKNYSSLYDSISPVNSFRVVLNKYFKADLSLLKDSTIRLY